MIRDPMTTFPYIDSSVSIEKLIAIANVSRVSGDDDTGRALDFARRLVGALSDVDGARLADAIGFTCFQDPPLLHDRPRNTVNTESRPSTVGRVTLGTLLGIDSQGNKS